MGLLLRVDVDKPYGLKNIPHRILSKLREDYWFPALHNLGYLSATSKFIEYCNANGIKGVFYFRNCTSPNSKIIGRLKDGGHSIGFHAEDTRSLDSFKNELENFISKLKGENISSFTKHGSGEIKLGRKHYPPFEPEKYKLWAKETGLAYYLGNGIIESPNDIPKTNAYYPKMFWMHKDYRNKGFGKLEDVIEQAKTTHVPVIIHPSNFIANKFVNSEFKKLQVLSQQQSLTWEIIN